MNTTHLSDNEILNHLAMFNTDPVVKRLIEMLQPYQTIVHDLTTQCGMTEYEPGDWRFDNYYEPWQYILHLEDEQRLFDDRMLELQDEINELTHKLSTRTVVTMLQDIHNKIDSQDRELREYRERNRNLEDEIENTRNKMKVWKALTTDTTR